MNNYYISFVVATRNDDHGTNIEKKNQYFVDRFVYLVEKYNLSAELIIVEWNPDPNKKKLSEVLKIPKLKQNLLIRIIEVEKKLHDRFLNSDKLNFFQMQAKNVGIRRAKGEFILCTNIDIIFSEKMFDFFSKKSLKHKTIYRADRYDLDFYLFNNVKVEEKILIKYLTHINKRDYTINVLTGEKFYIYKSLTVYLIEFFKKAPIYLYKNLTQFIKLLEKFPINLYKNLSKFKVLTYIFKKNIFKILGKNMFKFFLSINLFGKKIHTNACGDFTLIHKDVWFDCNAYYEYDGYSFHLDSILLFNALYKNYNFINLNEKIYHINHDKGFVPDNNDLFKRLDKEKIPYITESQLKGYVYSFKNKNTFFLGNDQWGFKDEKLTEKIFIAN